MEKLAIQNTKALNKSPKERIVYIDYLETIAIFLVVYCHFTSQIGTSAFANATLQFSTTVAVPLFFMVNGALLFQQKFTWRKHLKKIKWLMIAEISWKFVYLFVTILLSVLGHGSFKLNGLGLNNLGTYFLGGNLTGAVYVPAEHFWFINSLLAVYLIFPVIKACYDAKRHGIMFSVMIMLFLFEFVYTDFNDILKHITTIYRISVPTLDILKSSIYPLSQGSYLLYFILGIYAHEYFHNKKICIKFKGKIQLPLIITLTIGGYCLLLLEKYWQVGTLTGEWIRLSGDYQRVGTLVMSLGIFAIFASAEKYPFRRLNSLAAFFSSGTFNIYCIHMILAYWVSTFFIHHILYTNVLVYFIRTMLIFLLSVGLTAIMSYIPGINKLLGLKKYYKV